MPSANGVYSLPPGYLAVTGATIQASQHNPPLEDIAAALTARLSRDGTAAMTGAIQLASGTVALPGAVFSTDLTTGFYKTTSGIGVAVGGIKSVEFTAAGIASGNRLLGELVPYVCTTAPSSLWVLPFGQTLSRTAYAALWTQAQIEIANGNSFFNNGDGSTTFGIGDMRGRVAAAKDNMGGSTAGRLTATYFGGTGTNIGAVGGSESHTLTTPEIPSHNHTATDSGHVHTFGASSSVGTFQVQVGGTQGVPFSPFGSSGAFAGSTGSGAANITVGNAGGGGAHAIVQPTLITNYILFAGGPT